MADEKKFDVLAIGNAMVDILVKADDKFIESLGLKKGSMSLIEEDKAKSLFDIFAKTKLPSSGDIEEISGGCAANVLAGLSSFGGTGAFIGKVSKDPSGERFTKKLHERKIEFSTPAIEKPGTGRSLIIVARDGSRTMCTYLGSSQELSRDDIKEELLVKSKILYIPGFLWDCKKGKESAMAAIELAKKSGCKIAFSLSDGLCVKRHIKDFMDIIENKADLIFADRPEIKALFETDDIEVAVKKLQEKLKGKETIAAISCPKDGAIIVSKDEPVRVEAISVDKVIDKTGSGSLFVSGFLYAHTHGFDLEKSARLGNLSAAECLKHLGARPKIKLKDLLTKL